eukprot:scaffold34168_cov66-Phaeocystis_antarctica.AAC.5
MYSGSAASTYRDDAGRWQHTVWAGVPHHVQVNRRERQRECEGVEHDHRREPPAYGVRGCQPSHPTACSVGNTTCVCTTTASFV